MDKISAEYHTGYASFLNHTRRVEYKIGDSNMVVHRIIGYTVKGRIFRDNEESRLFLFVLGSVLGTTPGVALCWSTLCLLTIMSVTDAWAFTISPVGV